MLLSEKIVNFAPDWFANRDFMKRSVMLILSLRT